MGLQAGKDVNVSPAALPRGSALKGLLPQFDRLSCPVYIIIGAIFFAEIALFQILGFSVQSNKLLSYLAAPVAAIYSGTMFRRAGWSRTSLALEGAGLCGTFGHIMLLLQFPLASLAIGRPDELLIAADRYFQDPEMTLVLQQGYRSMIPQCAVVVALLAYTGRNDRAWQLITMSLFALILSVLPLPFFAAVGTHVGCGLKPADVIILENTCNFADAIHQIRDLGVRTIEPWMEVGIVSLPSFHSAAAGILVWAIWPFPWLRLPFLILNTLMCIAAIVIGQHYLIDIVAGIALAGMTIAILRRD